MAWDKIKSMFVVENRAVPSASVDDEAAQLLKDLEKYELPKGEVPPLPPSAQGAALTGEIDFQALYDQAGVPNTDEVEALERFLAGLDNDLPQASRVAAAKAFLGAIGKAPAHVLEDAGRKIGVVRAVAETKREETARGVAEHKAALSALQKQMDEHRGAIEALERDLESVRELCTVEESRLQSARVFFGYVGELTAEAPAPKKR